MLQMGEATEYGISRSISILFNDAVGRVTEGLAKEGSGDETPRFLRRFYFHITDSQ